MTKTENEEVRNMRWFPDDYLNKRNCERHYAFASSGFANTGMDDVVTIYSSAAILFELEGEGNAQCRK